jgi:Sec-independent protein translocase protein TatA
VNVTGWEFILLIVLAAVILGPERLPEYAAKLGRLVRQAKGMAEAPVAGGTVNQRGHDPARPTPYDVDAT